MDLTPGNEQQPSDLPRSPHQTGSQIPSQSLPQSTVSQDAQPAQALVTLGEGSADSQSLARRASAAPSGAPSAPGSFLASPATSPICLEADRGSLNASPMFPASALMTLPALSGGLSGGYPLPSALEPGASQLQHSAISQPTLGLSPEVTHPVLHPAASGDQPGGSTGLVEQPAVLPQRWLRTPTKPQEVSNLFFAMPIPQSNRPPSQRALILMEHTIPGRARRIQCVVGVRYWVSVGVPSSIPPSAQYTSTFRDTGLNLKQAD